MPADSDPKALPSAVNALAETMDAAGDALAETMAAAGTAAAAARDAVQHRIDRFVILRQLGRGGMGVVYAAYDEKLDRKVAVKLLHQGEAQSADQRRRVLREAQAMAQISHPNVIHAYEVGEVDDQVFLAMEYVEGTTLAVWQRQAGRPWDDTLRMYLTAGQGLLAAHRVGLVHRDFKPENVLVDPESRPLVADFGLAHVAGREEKQTASEAPETGRLLESPLTMAGSIVGTPAYMSPEQYRGEPADSRSDQFSFCAALYEALYKQLPFSGQDLAELSNSVLMGKIRPAPSGMSIPLAVEEALRRGLALDPARRFPSMAELLSALSADVLLHDPSEIPTWLRRVVMIAGLAAIFSMLVKTNTALLRGTLTVRMLLTGGVHLCLLSIPISLWMLKRGVLRNSFHRGLTGLVLFYALSLAGMRLIGLLLGLSVPQVAAVELMPLAWLTAAMSLWFLPTLAPVPLVCVAASIVIAIFPKLTWIEFGLINPLAAFAVFIAWRRATRRMSYPGSVQAL